MSNQLVIPPKETKSLAVDGPDIQALISGISSDIEIAPLMEVDSVEMLAEAQTMGGRIKTVIAAIEAERVARVKPLNDTVKWLNAGYNEPKEFLISLVEGAGGIKAKCIAFNQVLQQKQREADAEAQRAHDEVARIAAEAEAKARKAADVLVAQATEAIAAGAETVGQALADQAVATIETARQHADDAAVALRTQAVAPSVGKAKGIGEKWVADVTDKAALLKHIGMLVAAGDLSLIGLVEIDQSALNAKAKVEKEHMNLPGVIARPFSTMRMAKA